MHLRNSSTLQVYDCLVSGSLVAYTNVAVETLGEALVEVKAFGLMRKVLVMIVARHDTPLFGLDWCIEFGVQMPPGVKIGSIKQGDTGTLQGQLDSEVQALITEFGQLFEDKSTSQLQNMRACSNLSTPYNHNYYIIPITCLCPMILQK